MFAVATAHRSRVVSALSAALDYRWPELYEPQAASQPTTPHPQQRAAGSTPGPSSSSRGQQALQPAAAGGFEGERVRADVAACAWRLVGVASELDDVDVACLAGRLLAAVGPLDPHSLACDLALESSHRQQLLLHRLPSATAVGPPASSGRAGRRGAAATTAATAAHAAPPHHLVSLLASALLLLDECLVDMDPKMIRTALFTMREILATAPGKQALELLAAQAAPAAAAAPSPPNSAGVGVGGGVGGTYGQAYARLRLFSLNGAGRDASAGGIPGSQVEAVGATAGAGGPQADLHDEGLWRVGPSPATTAASGGGCSGGCSSGCDAWLVRLVPALVGHCHSRVLRLLRGACRRSALLCELVLPACLRDLLLAASADDPALVDTLGRMLTHHVLAPLDTDRRALRLVLGCLELLRGVHRDYVVATNGAVPVPAAAAPAGAAAQGKGESGRGGGRAGAGGTAAAQMEALLSSLGLLPGAPEPVIWARVYCVDVDYLLVAQVGGGTVCATVGGTGGGWYRVCHCGPRIPLWAPSPAPYTLLPHLTRGPTPYTLHPAPCALNPAPCTLHPAPCSLNPAPCTLNPTPCTLHPVL